MESATKMCLETHFRYDGCDHFAPKPARTIKCLRATAHKECNIRLELMNLSIQDCPECSGRERVHDLMNKRGLRVEDMNDSGFWEAEDVSLFSLMTDANRHIQGAPMYQPFRTLSCDRSSFPDHRPRKEPQELIEWNIPTRCFIKVKGFVCLDPWAADRAKVRRRAREVERERAVADGTYHPQLDLQHMIEELAESDEFAPRDSAVKMGPCCEEKTSLWNACSAGGKDGRRGRNRPDDDERSLDDWCISKF